MEHPENSGDEKEKTNQYAVAKILMKLFLGRRAGKAETKDHILLTEKHYLNVYSILFR